MGEGKGEEDTAANIPTWIQAAKVFAWPTVTVAMLLVFWSPISQIAHALPDIINRSETISVAGLSLKVQGRIEAQATPEVRAVVGKLGRTDLARIMSDSTATYTSEPGGGGLRTDLQHLVDLKLFEEVGASDLPTDGNPSKPYTYGARITALGQAVRDFLTEIVLETVTSPA